MTRTDSSHAHSVRVRLRLIFDGAVRLGPGKADLLELIDEVGSIAAAGRRMNMSYRRAWALVEEVNTAFTEPLVDSTRGGAKGGGAHLTDAGRTVLAHYRRLENRVSETGQAEIVAIGEMLKEVPEQK